MGEFNYKKAGVDISRADKFVRGISSFVSGSRMNKISAFGSLFDFKHIGRQYKSPVLVSSADGVGTKLKLAQKTGRHRGVGIDLVAMNVNDIICLGAKPLFFLDYIACGRLDPRVLKQVVEGIHQGVSESGCCLIGGETAEMPGMYKAGDYDLAGFCLGVAEKSAIIDGSKIKKGDKVIGVSSSGLHSNGFSLVRAVLDKRDIAKHKDVLLRPTRIYVKPILDLLSPAGGKASLKGIAHVTGGAFSSKATKIIPEGLSLRINTKSWQPPAIFDLIRKKARMGKKKMYSVFNMGIGLIVVTPSRKADKILKSLNKTYKSYIIGEIIESEKKLCLD